MMSVHDAKRRELQKQISALDSRMNDLQKWNPLQALGSAPMAIRDAMTQSMVLVGPASPPSRSPATHLVVHAPRSPLLAQWQAETALTASRAAVFTAHAKLNTGSIVRIQRVVRSWLCRLRAIKRRYGIETGQLGRTRNAKLLPMLRKRQDFVQTAPQLSRLTPKRIRELAAIAVQRVYRGHLARRLRGALLVARAEQAARIRTEAALEHADRMRERHARMLLDEVERVPKLDRARTGASIIAAAAGRGTLGGVAARRRSEAPSFVPDPNAPLSLSPVTRVLRQPATDVLLHPIAAGTALQEPGESHSVALVAVEARSADGGRVSVELPAVIRLGPRTSAAQPLSPHQKQPAASPGRSGSRRRSKASAATAALLQGQAYHQTGFSLSPPPHQPGASPVAVTSLLRRPLRSLSLVEEEEDGSEDDNVDGTGQSFLAPVPPQVNLSADLVVRLQRVGLLAGVHEHEARLVLPAPAHATALATEAESEGLRESPTCSESSDDSDSDSDSASSAAGVAADLSDAFLSSVVARASRRREREARMLREGRVPDPHRREARAVRKRHLQESTAANAAAVEAAKASSLHASPPQPDLEGVPPISSPTVVAAPVSPPPRPRPQPSLPPGAQVRVTGLPSYLQQRVAAIAPGASFVAADPPATHAHEEWGSGSGDPQASPLQLITASLATLLGRPVAGSDRKQQQAPAQPPAPATESPPTVSAPRNSYLPPFSSVMPPAAAAAASHFSDALDDLIAGITQPEPAREPPRMAAAVTTVPAGDPRAFLASFASRPVQGLDEAMQLALGEPGAGGREETRLAPAPAETRAPLRAGGGEPHTRGSQTATGDSVTRLLSRRGLASDGGATETPGQGDSGYLGQPPRQPAASHSHSERGSTLASQSPYRSHLTPVPPPEPRGYPGKGAPGVDEEAATSILADLALSARAGHPLRW